MAARTITWAGNQDMSSISSTASGSDPGTLAVSLVFDDADSRTQRQATITRIVEKLAEEGWL